MVSRRSLTRLFAFAFLSPLSCANEESVVPATVNLDLEGGFVGEIQGGNRLVIRAKDGRVLLDGLPPASIAADAPPLVGFASRVAVTTYETQFGAFRPTVTGEGPWRVASAIREGDAGLSLVAADGGEIARIVLRTPEEGHLIADLFPIDAETPDPATPERRTKLSWGFACDAEDHFMGFGSQTWDVDHRGQTVPTFVSEQGIGKSENDDYDNLWGLQGQRHSSHVPIPEYLSRRGYVLVAETARRAVFALCSESEKAARVEVDLPSSIHLFDGPTPPEALERATATFGRPRMPPLVAFAPWLDAIFGSENVRRVAQKLRDETIPVSVIWTEDWRGGDWDGESYALKEEWEVDRTLYPDFESVADDLHGLGFDLHVYFNPFIYEDSKAWQETEPNGYLVSKMDGTPYTFTGAKLTTTGLIDLDNPDARDWAIGKMQDAMLLGADGWMNDFAEWLPMDGKTASGPSYDRHNLYPVAWQEVAREAIDTAPDGRERLFFARSGWLGTPALADVFWAGDQRTTFDLDDGFPTLIPIALGLGIVGISTYGHDIAGYQSATNPGSTKELFFRWTSLGAWSPVMRTHHGNQPEKEWNWEKDAETIAHFRRYAALHMSLVPLMSGLAEHASKTGVPIWRGLAIHHPEDAEVWGIKDEVLVGDGLLVAPIVTAGATSREVYLPSGRWYPWNGGAPVEGPTRVTVDATASEIPVFARGGAVVPMFPDGVMTLVRGSAAVPDAGLVGDDRVVRVFIGGSGEISEPKGLSYSLTSTTDAVSGAITAEFAPTEGGPVSLEPCAATPVAPCIADAESTDVGIEVIGPGTITLRASGKDVATLVIRGGTATRAIHLRLAR